MGCGCNNDVQITPPPYEDVPCVDGEPCEEVVRAACVVYDNDDIPTGSTIENDDRLSEIIEKMVVPKVYNALLTQAGDAVEAPSEDPLVIGNVYVIAALESGDDFSNVGYVAEDVPFTATGTTPNDWSNATVVFNITSVSPTALVLANTIGTITYVYYPANSSVGEYLIKSNGLFIENKTQVFIGSDIGSDSGNQYFVFTTWIDSSTIKISTGETTSDGDRQNDTLLNTSIEIKIFN